LTVRNLPIGLFGAVMGLVGLGLSARATATVIPGVLRAPAYFTELWVALGVIAFVILLPCYLYKVVRYPNEAKAEFLNPIPLGFCGTLPVGMSLVAGGVAPYLPALGSVIWWASAVLMLAFQMWALYRWLSGGIELAQVNAGWLVVLVGGIVLPAPGIGLGHLEGSRFVFGVAAAGAAMLVPLLFYRAMVGPPLPEALRPTWFILLVPPSLIYANGLALYDGSWFLENLFYFGLALAVALLLYARKFWRWPVGAPWWAFTFPLDALAYAAARYAQEHPSPLWKAVAAATLVLATLFVVAVLARTLISARRSK
jgi:tellurite resistance protein